MHTIQEEPEDEPRESLSKVEPPSHFIRAVGSGWVENVTPSGRPYYWNMETKEKSWKPPRKVREPRSNSKSCSLPQNSSLSTEFNFSSGSEPQLSKYQSFDEEIKSSNVGKILRTGVLKLTEVDIDCVKVKKKWVKSFVVLTEFYFLYTTIFGSFRKLFMKTKKPNPNRCSLTDAKVMKDSETFSRGNVYKLQTGSKSVWFWSKKSAVAESWYQAITVVIEKLNSDNAPERERTCSFDMGVVLRKKCDLELSFGKAAFSSENVRSECEVLKHYPPPTWIRVFDPETDEFCYVDLITQKKCFWTVTDDQPCFMKKETKSCGV